MGVLKTLSNGQVVTLLDGDELGDAGDVLMRVGADGAAYRPVSDVAAAWGGITGTLSAQTDLQSALDAKQNDVTGSDTQVLFFDGANNPAGDAGLTYDKTDDSVAIGVNYSVVLQQESAGLRIGSNAGGYGASLILGSDDANTGAPTIGLWSSNGTTSTPAVTTAGNALGTFEARGYRDTFFTSAAQVAFKAAGVSGSEVFGSVDVQANKATDGLVSYLFVDGNADLMTAKRGIVIQDSGVKLTAASGVLTMAGLSGTTENLTFNFSAANLVTVGTGTGVTKIDFGTLELEAKFRSSDGSAGVTAGPFTTITSITVKDGIVTALTGS